MTMLQYETQVPLGGYITLPPEFYGRKVVVSAAAEQDKTGKKPGTDRPLDDGWRPDPAAGRKFFDTWDGLLEGMPDMTAKEIRAERLERKYGQ